MDIFSFTRPIKVGTHSGKLIHADEVFACASLDIIAPKGIEVIRTRDKKLLKKCDMRVDVGDMYNHETGDYDHHMSWFDVRHPTPGRKKILPDGSIMLYEKGPLRSGFGLIWLHYGYDVVAKILEDNKQYCADKYLKKINNDDITDIWQQLDNTLVATIDAVDNGEGDEFDINSSPFGCTDLSKTISLFFNTRTILTNELTDEESNALIMKKFIGAMAFAKEILTHHVINKADSIHYKNQFMKILHNRNKKEKILVLNKYIPWAYGYSKAGNLTDGVEMIVYPAGDGMWMCQSPKYYEWRDKLHFSTHLRNGTKRKLKHHAPEDICGLRDNALVKKTNVKGAKFVHKSGHLGVCNSKESAIELAKFIMDNGE